MRRKPITVTRVSTSLVVHAPYNDAYREAAKANGARWDATRKVWLWPITRAPQLADTLHTCYGYVPSAERSEAPPAVPTTACPHCHGTGRVPAPVTPYVPAASEASAAAVVTSPSETSAPSDAELKAMLRDARAAQ